MREVAARFGLLVNVSNDLSVRRSPCGHIWTGAGVVFMDQEQPIAPALAVCTEEARQQAMARFAVLRPHLNEDIPTVSIAMALVPFDGMR